MQRDIRAIVRGAYDLQKLRIQTGNRIVANWKSKHGQEPGEKEDSLSKEGKEILSAVRTHFRTVCGGLVVLPAKADFIGNEIISDYTELCLVAQFVDVEAAEADHFKRIQTLLEDYPIYTEYLKDIRGIGPAMAGVLLSEIDISVARYASSLWKYAGLDVAEDGAGRSRRTEHLIDKVYKDKKGKEKTKKSITFNPFLKTKLVGVLATSFLRAGEGPYRSIYDGYKNRLENRPDLKEHSKGHRHNMAIRYMIKMFLLDLWKEWRTMEGLPTPAPYHEAKLGIKHAA